MFILLLFLCSFSWQNVLAQTESWSPKSGDQVGIDSKPTNSIWMRLTGGWKYENSVLKPTVAATATASRLTSGDYVLILPSKDGTFTYKGIKSLSGGKGDGNKYFVVQSETNGVFNVSRSDATVLLDDSLVSYVNYVSVDKKFGYNVRSTSGPTEFTVTLPVKAGTYYCLFFSDKFTNYNFTGFSFTPAGSSEQTGSTTIATTNTSSTEGGTTWDFSQSNSAWTQSRNLMNAASGEWGHYYVASGDNTGDSYWSLTTLSKTEFSLPIVKGLQFTTSGTDDLWLDYYQQHLWIKEKDAITIPGLKKGQKVVFNMKYGELHASSNIDASDMTYRMLADGEATFTVTSNGGAFISSISVEDPSTVAGKQWDFTFWSDATITGLAADQSEYWKKTNRYFENAVVFSNKTFNYTEIKDLKFTTSNTQDLRINYVDGYIYMNSTNDYITIPNLKAGQTLTIVTESSNANDARGIDVTSGNATRVGGEETSTEKISNIFRVNADGDVTFHSSKGAIRVYSIATESSKTQTTMTLKMGKNDVTNIPIWLNTLDNANIYPIEGKVSNGSSNITYTSSNENILVVDDTGKIDFYPQNVTAGDVVTITAYYAGDATHAASSAYVTIVFQIKPKLTFSSTELTGVMGTGFKEPILTISPAGLKATYSSSDTSVATVEASTGEVTMLKPGTVTITATFNGEGNYLSNSASYNLTVVAQQTSANPAKWAITKENNANRFTFTSTGDVVGGLEVHDVPGVVVTFGAVGTQWKVNDYDGAKGFNYKDGNTGIQISASCVDANGKALPVSLNSDGLPTGGSYMVFKPIVNGLLEVDARYFQRQKFVIVNRDTKEVVNYYISSDGAESGNQTFYTPLKAGQRYYFYNAGSSTDKWALNIHGFKFIPVFLQSVGSNMWPSEGASIKGVEVYNNAQNTPRLMEGTHDDVRYYTRSENMSVGFTSGDITFKNDGYGLIYGVITHKADDGTEYKSETTAQITYSKSSFKFMQESATVSLNEKDLFVEPKLNYNVEGVTYTSKDPDVATVDASTGDVTPVKVGTTTITADPNGNPYFTGTVSYTLKVVAAAPVFNVINSEVELPVGTAGWNIIANNINVTNPTKIYHEKNTYKSYLDNNTVATTIAKLFYSFESSDATVARVNEQGGIDTRLPGTCTITVKMNKAQDSNGSYMSTATRTFKLVVPLIKYDLSSITYHVWDFTGGFTQDDINILKEREWTSNGDGSYSFTANAGNTNNMTKTYHDIPTSLTKELYFQPFNTSTKNKSYGKLTFNSQSSFDDSFGKYRISLDKPNATFLGVRNLKYGQTVAFITDNHGMVQNKQGVWEGDWLQNASDLNATQPADIIFPKSYKDPQDPDGTKYQHNRCTNVFLAKTTAEQQPDLGVEADNQAVNIRSVIQGYPAAYGFLNIGAGKASADNAPTYGYATVCSRLNISLEGQTAVKAYICDYYGYKNNKVHMQQIKNIPANTAVFLKGYARDIYCLYVNAGNAPVDAGVDDEVLASNKLIPCIYDTQVDPVQTINGEKYYTFGLYNSKFLRYGSSGTVPGGRCYLRLNEEEFNDLVRDYEPGGETNLAKNMTIVFEDLPMEDDNTTGITDIEEQDNTTSQDNGYYTLNGIKIAKPTKSGIYIHNGKKYIVK